MHLICLSVIVMCTDVHMSILRKIYAWHKAGKFLIHIKLLLRNQAHKSLIGEKSVPVLIVSSKFSLVLSMSGLV